MSVPVLPTHTLPEDTSYASLHERLRRLQNNRAYYDSERLAYIGKELRTITKDEWEMMAVHPFNVGQGSWTSQLCHNLNMLAKHPHSRMDRTCRKLNDFMEALNLLRSQGSLHDHLEAALTRVPDSLEIKELACLKQSLMHIPESNLEKLHKMHSTIDNGRTALEDLNKLVLELVQPFTEVQAARSSAVLWKHNADSFLRSLQQHNKYREQAERAIERIRNLVRDLLGHEWSMIWNENARELGLPPPGFPKPAHHIQAALSHSRRRFTPVPRG